MNGVWRLVMKQFGFGGTALGQCLHQRLLGNDVIRHEVILIGSGT
jgi:hypothetical protein